MQVLYPFAVGNDNAACVGQYVGEYDYIALFEYRVGFHGRRTVRCFYNKTAVEFFRDIRGDLIFKCSGNEYVAFCGQQSAVVDMFDPVRVVVLEQLALFYESVYFGDIQTVGFPYAA